MIEHLKYPIGQPVIPTEITTETIIEWIEIIEQFPSKLDLLTRNLTNEQLDTVYRPEGWTIRQVIHHCADSHQHSYTRFKWALTEDKPVIKAYYEERWAELEDSKNAPIIYSINVLKALHAKWAYFLRGLTTAQLNTVFIHPSENEEIKIKKSIGVYAWHCNHHYAHIANLLTSKKWS